MRHLLGSAFDVPRGKLIDYLPALHERPILEKPIRYSDTNYYFYKSHNAHEIHKFDNKKIVNDKIIYLVRNPLDVFVSFVNHLSKNVTDDAETTGMLVSFESVDSIVDTYLFDMLFATFCLYGTLQPKSVAFGSWFENAGYFLSRAPQDPRIVVVRYEDLLTDFDATFSHLLQEIGRHTDDVSEIYSKGEDATKQNGAFYWKKSSGTYKEYLRDEQIAQFIELHGKACEELGYTF